MKIRNFKTKVEKEVTKEQFEAIQKNPLTKGKWVVLEGAKVPQEVKELETKNATAKVETPKNTIK